MSWYEYQPFKWVLENLSAKEITNLLVGIIIISLLVGSYYVYLNTIQSIRNNPNFSWVMKNVSIFSIIGLIFFLIFSVEFKLMLGIDI